MPGVITSNVIMPSVLAFLDWNANDKKRKKRGNKKWKYFETDPLMKGKETGKQGRNKEGESKNSLAFRS